MGITYEISFLSGTNLKLLTRGVSKFPLMIQKITSDQFLPSFPPWIFQALWHLNSLYYHAPPPIHTRATQRQSKSSSSVESLQTLFLKADKEAGSKAPSFKGLGKDRVGEEGGRRQPGALRFQLVTGS